jgi:hypothetical protein
MADEVVSHASAADRQAAVTVATLIQNSGMWYVFGAISLIGPAARHPSAAVADRANPL